MDLFAPKPPEIAEMVKFGKNLTILHIFLVFYFLSSYIGFFNPNSIGVKYYLIVLIGMIWYD